MNIVAKDFRLREGDAADLDEWPTRIAPICQTKNDYKALLTDHVDRLSARQNLLYASNRHAVLIIFQAMDTAGKDGAIKHVMSGVNPQGCQVFSFSHPTPAELRHDFLWRTTRNLPERGKIGIFNRSYYEEVLIARVHPEILRSEGVPGADPDEPSLWNGRYRSIVDLEWHLHANGTRIVKIFLHLSKEEQRKRLLERIEDKAKNWKFSQDDIKERKYWKKYMRAYEACMAATTTHHAPWHIVPADSKHNARLIVSQIVLDTLDSLKMCHAAPDAAKLDQMQAARKALRSTKE